MRKRVNSLLLSMLLLALVSSIFCVGIYAKENTGKYLNYDYSYIKKDGQYIFLFTPPLERDDLIVTGAMFAAIEAIDGKHQLLDIKPKTKKINNINYIWFDGKNCDYYFLIYKEDSGTVYAFVMSKI